MHPLAPSRRFITQLILIFGLFTLGTTLSFGIPVTLLLERQTERQLEALLDQSDQTMQAIYQNKISQLKTLGLIITGRPTLKQMVEDGAENLAINVYLENLLVNAGVDGLFLCQGDGIIAGAGEAFDDRLCQTSEAAEGIVIDDPVWLTYRTVLSGIGRDGIDLVVGQYFSAVLEEFSEQSGLNYVLIQNDQIIAVPPKGATDLESVEFPQGLTQYQRLTDEAQGKDKLTYMAAVMPLEGNPPAALVGLLNITPYISATQRLRTIIFITLLAIGAVSTAIAILISRRISEPINQLALAAVDLREGNLEKSLSSASKVWEINQLTNALEDARVSLKHTLDQLRMEKAWMEDLLNSIVEGLLTIDERGRITFVSEGVERIVGFESVALLGKAVDEIFPVPPGEESFRDQLPGVYQSRRIPVLLKNQETLLAVSASEFIPPDAGNARLALVIRDVTDEERIHRLMGEFMANITHEFRTPLAALAASVELLQDQLPGLSMVEIEALLHALNIGVINLQALIDNLIETASIEAGRFKVNPHPVEIHVIIRDAVNTISPIAAKQGVSLTALVTAPSPRVRADLRRTSQALVNLLSNAIKNSREGGRIKVTALIVGQSVLVEVEDDGAGVPSDLNAHIFNRFTSPNLEDESRQTGLGLGLSVVKAIIEAQQGKVGYRESDTGGALFWFTLPLAEGLKP